MLLKDVSVFLRDAITHLAATNRGKLEGIVNVCIQVDDDKPFPKKAEGCGVKHSRWTY
jgi:hypothetical protein